MVEFIKGTLYTCDCGYKTTNNTLACKHSKTLKCKENTIRKQDVNFVLEDDHNKALSDLKSTLISGDNSINAQTINGNVNMTNITINLTVPDKSVIASVHDAVKNPECVRELRGADPQQIPAILFKYTRGIKADKQYIKYDPDKNVVKHLDPVTNKEVARDLKKYRDDYLVKNADIYDDDLHLQYMPNSVRPVMKSLTVPTFETGKKKDPPIPAADVIKMCASGDHRMYKLPHDSKKFYKDVAENVDNEIKITTE
ncbi:protein of unknown function (DUF1390) [Paramecium bursaria Chlorella virus IL3A]|uniref:Uncharacterized protein n=1 Tax=Paramecium bursaria Chlorella virus IL3A TaxID=46019 RepID=M1I5H3_PBCVI|nr:protein of unknown function (DUF1390) [Paramecium bursaria Chlorella virus IL3A]